MSITRDLCGKRARTLWLGVGMGACVCVLDACACTSDAADQPEGVLAGGTGGLTSNSSSSSGAGGSANTDMSALGCVADVSTEPASMTAATEVATGSAVVEVEAAAGEVLFTVAGVGVYRLVNAAAMPELLVARPPNGIPDSEGPLRADASYVYFTLATKLWRSTIALSSVPELIADTSENSIEQLRIDGSYAYYTTGTSTTDTSVYRVSTAGGTPEELASNVSRGVPFDVSEATVYYVPTDVTPPAVATLSADTRKTNVATDFPEGPRLIAIAAPDKDLFWSDGASLYVTPIDNAKRRTQIGRAASVAGTVPAFKRLWLFGDRIYWLDSGNNVGWTQTDGARCATVWKGKAPDTLDGDTTKDVAVTFDSIYLVNGSSFLGPSGRLMRLPLSP